MNAQSRNSKASPIVLFVGPFQEDLRRITKGGMLNDVDIRYADDMSGVSCIAENEQPAVVVLPHLTDPSGIKATFQNATVVEKSPSVGIDKLCCVIRQELG